MARSNRYTRKILASGDRSKWSDLYISDSNKIILGAGSDLEIYHDGTDNHIEATSALNIATANSGVAVKIGHSTSEVSISDNLTITGNLTVNGTTTTINSTTLTVDDKNVVLASGAADSAAADGAGITVDGASATILYEHDDTSWNFNKPTNFAGNITAVNLNLTDTDGGNMIILDSSSGDGVIRWEDNNTQKWDIGRDNTDQAFVISNEGGLGDNQVVHINHSTGEFTLKGALTVGVDDTGHDVKFFGATSGAYMLWDESANQLRVSGASVRFDGTGDNFILKTDTGNLKIQVNETDHDLALQCDDGSGGVTSYLTLKGNVTKTLAAKNIEFQDNVKAEFGEGDDLEIYHDGTDSFINNDTGDLYIKNNTNDKDIIFQCDDGSGGTTEYFRLDGAGTPTIEVSVHTNFYDTVNLDDNVMLALGTGNDLQIKHTGSESTITNNVGQLTFIQNANDNDIVFKSDNGSGGTTAYITLDGSATKTVFSKPIEVGSDGAGHDVKFFLNASGRYIMVDEDDNSLIFTDNANAKWGNGGDLQLMHDGTDSRIDNMVGHLKIRNYSDDSDIIFESDNGSGSTTEYLRFDGGDVKTYVSKDMKFNDSVYATFGNNDLLIGHDSTNSRIYNYTGNLQITNFADNQDIIFQCDDGSGGVTTYITLDGSETRTTFSKNARFNDDVFLQIGSSADLYLVHSSGDSSIVNGVGDLYIKNGADDKDIIFQCDDGSGGLTPYITLDGSETEIHIHKTVGIGTTNPDTNYKLDVAGKVQVQGVLELDDVLTLNAISTPADPGTNKSSIYMDSADGAIRVKINVGGTTVTRTLATFE